jgi:hypothetical protein
VSPATAARSGHAGCGSWSYERVPLVTGAGAGDATTGVLGAGAVCAVGELPMPSRWYASCA